MNIRQAIVALCCTAWIAGSTPHALGQGRFANFETPQTHPIDIATVNGADYVLVCNTPDNSVDIYTAAPPHTFIERIPVGMGPGTVRWNASLQRFYTCNFDGDSVSIVSLAPSGGSVHGTLLRTTSLLIGDEPADIAFDPASSTAAVTLCSRSSVTFVSANDLSFAGGEARLTATDPASGQPFALKMPRSLAWLPGGRIFAANLRAGSARPGTTPVYDMGLYRFDPARPAPDFIGGLGTTNHAFAINSAGTQMFIVGTKAQNNAAVGVQAVGALKTGFVQSWLMVVDIPPGGAMSVHPQAPAGTLPTVAFPSINLNRNYSVSALTEVATTDALVQPTGIQLIESGGVVTKIVISAYHSDRVAVLTPSLSAFGGYTIQRVNIPVLNPASSYTVSGPRGLAYSALNNRVFVADRLDNTLAAINPTTATLTAQVQLPNDPTPSVIREGRQFLYSNRFSMNNSSAPATGGFVSCAACHVDGRTDGLPWDLGDINTGPVIAASFHDQNGQSTGSMPKFPSEKGPLVTQTLQGLVNYELDEFFQFAATNAPYHWRGDKSGFTDFNEAFVNLQRMANINTPADPKGITDADMIKYRRFVNTILYPPNPEQDLNRVVPGTLGAIPDDEHLAKGAKLGELLFHDFPMVGSRGCVDCHALPDGSSNTSTEAFNVNMTLSGGAAQLQPFETAALRGIAQREAGLHNDFTSNVTQFTGNSGLLHPGDPIFFSSRTINTFITGTFTVVMPGLTAADRAIQVQAMTQFVRQLDTGTAPLAGFSYTIDPTANPLDSGANKAAFDLGEAQVAEANIGLGVFTLQNGAVHGFWLDTTLATPAYREEGTTNLTTRAALLALAAIPGNVVILQATPLGTERRWASSNGVATLISNPSAIPANLVLEKMAPNTAFVDIPKFGKNLNLTAPANSSIWTERTLQQSAFAAGGMGVPSVRHEPPRRFRITGDNIRPGAKMLLGIASGTTAASLPVQVMVMDLYPTTHLSNGRQVWETLAELDATQTFALLNGGYWAPDVLNVLMRTVSAPLLKPTTWNKYLVGVLNEDGTLGFSTTNWQVLRIQDNR